ncbi:nuclear transport factor 2 family protein [Micromonospora deserti]|uniref:Nuclear transport factor 2 family protein n=1 Tax=Micromonospora deserti TaxID=2070366 RepID=A0A2W2CQA7_9ACTN|nr:nuclear transport factor 2 family protein [Micromonospora deserti]PZG00753.1 nuclear transport factor 2 family protein [Micromonospora deserti]
MAVVVPDVINRYYRAVNDGDTDAFVDCFAENASVSDEDRIHEGRAAIRAWRERTAASSPYTADPVSAEAEAGDNYVVTSRVSGTFPGSPILLRFRFTLRDGLIGALDIRP